MATCLSFHSYRALCCREREQEEVLMGQKMMKRNREIEQEKEEKMMMMMMHRDWRKNKDDNKLTGEGRKMRRREEGEG